MSAYPFKRRKPFTASRMPAATQRSIICPPRHRLTFRLTSRVRLIRLSAAFVVASERRSRGESFKVSTVSVSSRPFAHALGGTGILGLQTAGQIEQQPLRRLHLRGLIGAAEDRLGPGTIAVAEVLEDVSCLVDLATLNERGLPERGAYGFAQR